jgi:hypothetical protein
VKTKDIVLWSFIAFLFVLPFVMIYFRGENPKIDWSNYPDYVPIEEILPVHEGRIKKQVDLLKKQSLDETFVYLQDDQQYSYPGYNPPSGLGTGEGSSYPGEMERILSSRGFLKVFQQFEVLLKEQAVEKARTFCKRAIKDFNTTLEIFALNEEGIVPEHPSADPLTFLGARYMLATSMLLAAYAGEHKLLIDQIDETQRITNACVERIKKNGTDPGVIFLAYILVELEDDCILTALMHALKRADVADIPFEETFSKKTIPLYRWDASLTYYDFEVGRTKKLDPKDAVEQFDVYAFTGKDRHSRQQRRHIIDALKERLSMQTR